MHGVLITFETAATLDDVASPFTQHAEALQSQTGLISKAWISTGEGFGGFYVFADQESAASYLAGELAAGLLATEGFDNFVVQQFHVLDKFSAMTGVNPVAA